MDNLKITCTRQLTHTILEKRVGANAMGTLFRLERYLLKAVPFLHSKERGNLFPKHFLNRMNALDCISFNYKQWMGLRLWGGILFLQLDWEFLAIDTGSTNICNVQKLHIHHSAPKIYLFLTLARISALVTISSLEYFIL